MPFIIALIVYVHASYCYGSWLAHLATSFRSWRWVQSLGPSGVGRVADVLAMLVALGVYALAGGFGP